MNREKTWKKERARMNLRGDRGVQVEYIIDGPRAGWFLIIFDRPSSPDDKKSKYACSSARQYIWKEKKREYTRTVIPVSKEALSALLFVGQACFYQSAVSKGRKC